MFGYRLVNKNAYINDIALLYILYTVYSKNIEIIATKTLLFGSQGYISQTVISTNRGVYFTKTSKLLFLCL